MTKKQKIWFGIFSAMFLVPEVLWSPVITYIAPFFAGSSFKFRNSVLFSGNMSPYVTTLVIAIQFVGLLLSAILLKRTKAHLAYYWFTGFLCVVVGLVFLFHLVIGQSDLLGL